MQFCKETLLKKFQAKMELEPTTCENVLHTALPSELSKSESWASANSIFHPILSERGQVPYISMLYKMS